MYRCTYNFWLLCDDFAPKLVYKSFRFVNLCPLIAVYVCGKSQTSTHAQGHVTAGIFTDARLVPGLCSPELKCLV